MLHVGCVCDFVFGGVVKASPCWGGIGTRCCDEGRCRATCPAPHLVKYTDNVLLTVYLSVCPSCVQFVWIYVLLWFIAQDLIKVVSYWVMAKYFIKVDTSADRRFASGKTQALIDAEDRAQRMRSGGNNGGGAGRGVWCWGWGVDSRELLCSCPMYFNTVCDRWEWKCMAGLEDYS